MSAEERRGAGKQSGASAVEFALVLPLLIALTYGTFVFSYLYIVHESINYAAQQGAEAAVAVDPSLGDDYAAQICTFVDNTIRQGALQWLLGDDGVGPIKIGLSYGDLGISGSGPIPVDEGCGSYDEDSNALAVKVTYTVPSALNLGFLPALPTSISGLGVVLLGS
jgi:hypothetical protein